MFFLYRLTNTISGTIYHGVSNDPKQRLATHKSVAVKGKVKSPLACAMRSYGSEVFLLEVLEEYKTRQEALSAEIEIIAKCKEEGIKNYNLHPGGSGGFSMLEKSPQEIEEWRAKKRVAREGQKPALGMKHTEENKKLFGEYGKLRWDIYGRYPQEVLDHSFINANKKFGISKTHYYRLKKQLTSNDSR